jgi:integrase
MPPVEQTQLKPRKRKPKYPTWEHPDAPGIKIAEMPNRTGRKVFGVSYQIRIPGTLLGQPNKREMHQRKTKAEAERLAQDRFMALKKHGTEFSKIPTAVQKQAAIAWSLLDEHNQQTRLELNLIDVVRAGMKALSPTGGLRTFAEVAEELRASKKDRKEGGTYDASSERNFRTRSLRLEKAGLGEKLVSQLVGTDIQNALSELRKLDGGKLSARSILNFRRILAEIFEHAVAKQYTPTNPLEQLAKEDLKRLGGEKQRREIDHINILTPDEARRLLDAALEVEEPGMLATLVLRLFCGLRTGEVSRLDWSEVHWLDEKPFVHIPAGKAKKRSIRLVNIPSNALAWLKLCDPKSGGRIDPGSPKTYAKRFGRIPQLAGMGKEDAKGNWQSGWEINDTRHSFGSYHYALYGDSVRTAAEMGHKQGDDVLFAHYRSLVRKEEAEAYFGIMPSNPAGKVTEFPQAAVTA